MFQTMSVPVLCLSRDELRGWSRNFFGKGLPTFHVQSRLFTKGRSRIITPRNLSLLPSSTSVDGDTSTVPDADAVTKLLMIRNLLARDIELYSNVEEKIIFSQCPQNVSKINKGLFRGLFGFFPTLYEKRLTRATRVARDPKRRS